MTTSTTQVGTLSCKFCAHEHHQLQLHSRIISGIEWVHRLRIVGGFILGVAATVNGDNQRYRVDSLRESSADPGLSACDTRYDKWDLDTTLKLDNSFSWASEPTFFIQPWVVPFEQQPQIIWFNPPSCHQADRRFANTHKEIFVRVCIRART
uniref:Uncharacterized protein n=1 Tax=Stomoxys calcitrans TaxID=35570 RepID=A0A1I8QBN0_STOCA